MNGAVSKVTKKFISHLTRAQRTPSAAATVMRYQQFALACLLQGCGASFQDGVAVGKGFLCAPFWGVHICDYSAVHGLEKTHHASLFLLRRHLGNWPRSPAVSTRQRTAGSAWETWTVAAADGVRCARVRWEMNFLVTFETAPFICKHTVE